MRKLSRPVIFLPAAILLAAFVLSKPEKYQVEIVQDGKALEIVDNKVVLEKKPFQIRITLLGLEGVFMSASFVRDYFDLKDTEEIKDFQYLGSKTNVESNFNEEKQLIVHDEYVSFLFYDPELNWHRFDKDLVIEGKTVTGTKTVDKVWNQETEETTAVSDIDRDIFLFFVATEEGKKGMKEIGRRKIQLTWK